MADLKRTDTRPNQRHAQQSDDLQHCTHVWVRVDSVKRPLQPPYRGPFRVISRGDKTFVLDINCKHEQVSIDRLKVAYAEDDELVEPTEPLTLPTPSFENDELSTKTRHSNDTPTGLIQPDPKPKTVTRSDASDESNDEEESGGVQIIPGAALPNVELDPEAIDVDLIHRRIDAIQGFEILQKVETLCLRQNDIKRIEGLDTLSTLTELDLYDNKLTKIENLGNLINLQQLDLSFNKIRKIENLEALVNLIKLFLVHNKISEIQNLRDFSQLTMLELGDNRIRKLENLEALVNLESLFIGKNKISKLENLGQLKKLKLLSIQSNRIIKIENLGELESLEELYLSHNSIEVIENLDENVKLTTLDLAGNKIKRLSNLSKLTALEEFWFNSNLLEHWPDIDELKFATRIQTVYFEHNPIQKDPMYRKKIKLSLPSLTQIDATLV
ncbi:putative protein phosphatase 1 regulatory subunit 7 [Apostichopus japonicus]|uniref:Protein phosphatase 1 regulatory subunit 7 n=1 Tax=Stichopus japonicus TaxID=307972 RepID=A0A2G8KA15_STIJA|nr:putative protein phosphatase 1 regulatory subunit 7 [Apostichopus japonicus]